MNRLAKFGIWDLKILLVEYGDVQGEGDNQINESFIRHVESVSKQIKPKRLNLSIPIAIKITISTVNNTA
jgi:hypothetical protein